MIAFHFSSHARFSAGMLVLASLTAAAIAIAVNAFADGFSMAALDIVAGQRLTIILAFIGKWLCIMAVGLALICQAPQKTMQRGMALLAPATLPIAAGLHICIGLPVEAYAALAGISGLIVATGLSGRGSGSLRAIAASACISTAFVVIGGWWLISSSGQRIFAEAIRFSAARAAPEMAANIEKVEAFVPVYLEVAKHLSYLPFSIIWVFGGMALISFHQKRTGPGYR